MKVNNKKLNSDTPVKKGDMIWVKLKGPANDYGYGEVDEVWFDNTSESFLYTFYCLVNGGVRIGNVSDIIEKPTGRMKNKLLISRNEYQEIMKERYRR
tara:strand:- start:128 stop:421 length:294 start_codon:yes stop_codon:yes gene_type:complete